jgi:hypothetical protein
MSTFLHAMFFNVLHWTNNDSRHTEIVTRHIVSLLQSIRGGLLPINLKTYQLTSPISNELLSRLNFANLNKLTANFLTSLPCHLDAFVVRMLSPTADGYDAFFLKSTVYQRDGMGLLE